MQFVDRCDAGRRLAAALEHLRGRDPVVLGLPRGGVPVAAVVAETLGAPLDVIVVRKLGVPSHPELAMGAVGEGGAVVVNDDVLAEAGVGAGQFARVEVQERRELARRVARYRRSRGVADLRGRQVVIVDDGMATGATARAACQVARALGAARVVLAVPVAPADTVAELAAAADEVVLLHRPASLFSVGQFYEDFLPTSDSEVEALLVAAADRVRARRSRPPCPPAIARSSSRYNPGGCQVIWWCRTVRGRLSCSPTAARAAGTARATGTWPTGSSRTAWARC